MLNARKSALKPTTERLLALRTVWGQKDALHAAKYAQPVTATHGAYADGDIGRGAHARLRPPPAARAVAPAPPASGAAPPGFGVQVSI